jgi:hypothetical protein
MGIRMPKTVNAICTICNYKQEVNWSIYGSEADCVYCDEPAAYVVKIEESE